MCSSKLLYMLYGVCCTLTFLNITSVHLTLLLCIVWIHFISIGIIGNLSTVSYISVSIVLIIISSFVILRALDFYFSTQAIKQASLATSMYVVDIFLLHLLLGSVELISYLFRSCSLGFSYAANGIAGHLLMHILCSLIIVHYFILFLSVFYVAVLCIFEYSVIIVQSSILCLLIYVYSDSM